MRLKVMGAAVLLCSFVTLANAQLKHVTPTTATASAKPDASLPYNGGPVLGTAAEGVVNVYLIFYGNWAGKDPTGPGLMQNFVSNMGGTPYWNIFTTYTKPAQIQNAVNMNGTYTDTGSQGSNLSDSSLQTVVRNAITGGHLPADSNALYLVLTSSEVNETSGFCSQYCGFHNHMSASGKDIKYSFVGNPVHCTAQGGVRDCQGKASNITASPNNDPGVDAMISVIAHETGEAITDPDLNAWTGSSGEEGDICAYTYGKTFAVGNGSVANVTFGGTNYLIQRSFSIKPTQHCALHFP